MMAYDDYEMNKDLPTFKDKMHKEAVRRRQYMQQCPICKEYREFITNVHCVNEHDMTKKEVEAVYGKIVSGATKSKRDKG